MYGISYGGFIAGVINSLDLLGGNFIEKTALVSPPVRFGKAIQNMDALGQSVKKYQSYPDWILSLMAIPHIVLNPSLSHRSNEWKEPKPSSLSQDSSEVLLTRLPTQMIYMVGVTFQEALKVLFRNGASVTFNYYFENFFPVLKELYYSNKSYLFNWVNIRGNKIIILSASDDPLNINVSWPGSENIFLTKMGGHYGFANSEFYNNFLSEVSSWMKK